MGFYPASLVILSYSRMNNFLPEIIPRKYMFVCWICLLSLFPMANAAVPTTPTLVCPNTNLSTTSTYAPNSTYQTNLNALLSALSSNSYNTSNGFYNFTAGGSPPDVAYGLFLCRGDVSAAVCGDCVAYATGYAVQRCPGSKRVMLWFSECLLRYDNVSMFAIRDTTYHRILTSGTNVTNAPVFTVALGEVMDDIATRASRDGSGQKFATNQTNYAPLQYVYGLAQCTPDLSNLDCSNCLQRCISTFQSTYGMQGARVLFPSCFVRYESFPFYNANSSTAAPPVLSSSSPPSSLGKRTRTIIISAVFTIIGVIGFIVCICIFLRKKKQKKKKQRANAFEAEQQISIVQSLQYDFEAIRSATDEFSDSNKLGQGGFGTVYKGKLLDGPEIAVKRLAKESLQGEIEFKNEVMLVAKLQHRNLVRLLGFSLERTERLLIYEFLPKSSLDHLIFDPNRRELLGWDKRYKIIVGVSRGLLYLHEDSRLRIIHRDLKPSNILLDEDMNPKIADFGMARLFVVDETQRNTSRIVGTYGYMAPEYAMHGRFSIKSDVFSFGVLLLEILSGQKNNSFADGETAEDLLSYAWKTWKEGTASSILDPTLRANSGSMREMIRCIHIGLLCVQDNAVERPTMASVVVMLSSSSLSLPIPSEPAFFMHSARSNVELPLLLEHNSGVDLLDQSKNEITITELDPR